MNEKFIHFLPVSWDVQKAKEILRNKPREIQQINVSGCFNYVKRPKTNPDGSITCTIGHCVDWEKVDSDKVDISFPVIVAYLPKSDDIWIIDGWHRIAKAAEQKIDTLPCVCLTKEESKQCLI